MAGGEESAAPHPGHDGLHGPILPLGDQDHEAGQALVLAAQSVAQPGAHAGPARLLAPGLDEGHGRIMVDGFGMHRLHHQQVIHDPGRVRQQLADPGPGLAVLGEPEKGRDHRELRLLRRHAGDALSHADGAGQFGASQLVEPRFIVEEVQLGGSARLVQKDHPLGAGSEVGQAGQPPFSGSAVHGAGGEFGRQERGQRRGAHPQRGSCEEMPPRPRRMECQVRIHRPFPGEAMECSGQHGMIWSEQVYSGPGMPVNGGDFPVSP